MMRNFIRVIDEEGLLGKITVGYIAAKFALSPADVKAEIVSLKEGA